MNQARRIIRMIKFVNFLNVAKLTNAEMERKNVSENPKTERSLLKLFATVLVISPFVDC